MKNTITQVPFKKLLRFDEVATTWLKKDSKNSDTPLAYAIEKVFEQIKDIVVESNKVVEKQLKLMEIESYIVSENGNLIKGSDGGYVQSIETLKKYTEKRIDFINQYNRDLEQKTFPITKYIVTSDTGLTKIEKEAFKGLVF